MKFRTTLILLALLALVAGAVTYDELWRSWLGETEVEAGTRLFPAADASFVDRIRVDQIERGYTMVLERDSQGLWYITDPIEYPANAALVTTLLEDVNAAKGLGVPAAEQGERELGFDPPRVVLEVREMRPEGPVVHQIEIGATDLDRIRVNVRRDGRYLRTLVRLFTTLNKPLQDFRSLRAMTIAGEQVVEIQRTGRVQLEQDEDSIDLGLSAFRDGRAWRANLPWRSLLGALDVGVVVFGATRLEVQSFVEDEVRDLSIYGLDRPEVRLELKAGDGRGETLLLGRTAVGQPWFVKREDAPFVWSVDPENVLRLLYPFEAMVDLRFMRVLRREVDALRLSVPGRGELRVLREAGGWSVVRVLPGGESSAPLVADARLVDEALGRLEGLELAPPGDGGATLVDPELLGSALYLEVAGETLGGRLSAPGASGEHEGVVFQRSGDELQLLGEAWLAELCARPLEEWRSRLLVRLVEQETKALELEREGQLLRFERDGRGLWRRAGEEREAAALLPLLDPLIYLKAGEFLAEDTPLVDPIRVRFERFQGEPVEFLLGGTPAGEAGGPSRARVAGELSTLQVADLHPRVAALFED